MKRLTPEQLGLLSQAGLAFKRFWRSDDEATAHNDFVVGVALIQELVESLEEQSDSKQSPPVPIAPASV